MNYMLRTRNTGQLNIDRVFARLFTIGGGVFWIAAFFGGTTRANYTEVAYTLPELAKGATSAFIPLALVVAVLVLGFFYERLTGIVLAVVAVVMIVWGAIVHPLTADPVLWVTAFSVLVLPSLIAGALFELAARRQEGQEEALGKGAEAVQA
jgi:hypothetical protein